MTQTELLYKDPLAAAEKAASEIAAKTGIAHHDVALKSSLDFLPQRSKAIRAKSAHMKLKVMERSYMR
jgi:hypothetical protein